MKCNKCGAEWNVGKSMAVVTKCPFCGEIFNNEETKNEKTADATMDLAAAFKRIVNDRGEDVLKDEVFLNLFSDYAPELNNEKRLLKFLFHELQINQIFLEESGSQANSQDRRISKAIRKMKDNFQTEETIEMVVTAFVGALHWDEGILPKYFKEDDEKKKEVAEPEDKQGDTLQSKSETNLPQQNNRNIGEEVELLYQEAEMYYHGHGIDKNYAKAKYYYEKAAEQGHIDAQFKLGVMYYEGEGVAKDPGKAVEWYQKAADQGHSKAQINLGAIFFNGEGVNSSNKARELFQKADLQGEVQASYYLGLMYQNGWGVNRNNTTAKNYYEKAAGQGHADAKKKLEEVTEILYNESIIDAEAQCLEGQKYYNEQKYEKAMEWWLRAAKQGHAVAQNNLGTLYEQGQGVAQNYGKAAEWYRKAAEQGYALAQNNLGVMYEQGQGVAQNYGKAAEWYRKAVEQGYAWAHDNLGLLYVNGNGVTKDYHKALELFQKADEQEDMYAPYILGVMYENGEGVNTNINTAKQYYKKASERGHADAKKKLEEIELNNTIEAKFTRLRQAFDEDFWNRNKGDVSVLDLVSVKKARNVVKTYAKNTGIQISDIKVLFDKTIFGSGDEGLIMTNDYLIGSEGKTLIPLNQISHLKVLGNDDDNLLKVIAFLQGMGSTQQEQYVANFYNSSDWRRKSKEVIEKINEIFFNWHE